MEEDGRQRTRPPRESFLVVQEYWVVWSRTRIQDFEHRGGYSRPRGAVTVELADSALLPRDLPLVQWGQLALEAREGEAQALRQVCEQVADEEQELS